MSMITVDLDQATFEGLKRVKDKYRGTAESIEQYVAMILRTVVQDDGEGVSD